MQFKSAKKWKYMFLKNETRQNKNTKEKKEFPLAGVEPQTFSEKRNISFQNDISHEKPWDWETCRGKS